MRWREREGGGGEREREGVKLQLVVSFVVTSS